MNTLKQFPGNTCRLSDKEKEMESMGIADNALQEYWEDEEKFADLFNALLFGGKKIILPEQLTEADTRKNATVKKNTGNVQEKTPLYRDLVKVAKIYKGSGVELVILGLENQEHIHYAMPMRVLGYDYSEYKKQYRRLAKQYTKQYKGLSEDEYLSKMKRTDRLHPVITIVIYYGEKGWDGAKSLHEMLDISEELEPYVNDYKMHLIEVRNNNLPLSHPNNRALFQLCSIILDEKKTNARKQEEIIQYEKENKIDEEVLYALAGVTNCNLHREEKRGEMSMCTFFESMKEEARQEGIELGIERGIEQGIERGIERGIEQGIERGIEQGIERGIEHSIIGLTMKKISKNLSVMEIADMLETDINFVQQIYDIKAANPEYEEKEIFEAIQKAKA